MAATLGAVVLVTGATRAFAASPAHAANALRRPPLPTILTMVESSAEDIVDDALAHDRAEVIRRASELRSAANGRDVRRLSRSGVPAADVADLGRRATRVSRLARSGSFVGVALAANDVSELVPELYARFRNPVPPVIGRLDYLEREIELRSIAAQPRRVAQAMTELERVWPRARRKVVAAGGSREAAVYGRHVATLGRLAPGSGRAVQAEAVRGLALVDDLERVFVG